MMIMYKIVCENGFQGIKYYKNYEDAIAAAAFREIAAGRKWFVQTVILK